MIRKYRRIRWKRLAVFVLAGVTVLSVFSAIYGYCGWRRCFSEKQELENLLNSYSHMVYVAAEKIPKGTVLTADKLNQEVRYFNLTNLQLISEDALGKKVLSDVEEGTCLTNEMLSAEWGEGKDVFLSGIEFQNHVQEGDRVDVRIRYANAEDYTVLADKMVKIRDDGNGMVLELTEEEILYMSSAFSDKNRYEGVDLYVVKYPEYNNPATGMVNYIPNKEILMLLGKEEKEGESRTSLEKRLMQQQ